MRTSCSTVPPRATCHGGAAIRTALRAGSSIHPRESVQFLSVCSVSSDECGARTRAGE